MMQNVVSADKNDDYEPAQPIQINKMPDNILNSPAYKQQKTPESYKLSDGQNDINIAGEESTNSQRERWLQSRQNPTNQADYV